MDDYFDVIFIVVAVLIGLFTLIGKAIAYAVKNANNTPGSGRQPTQGADYVAPKNTVRDVLRNLQQTHQTDDPDIVVLPTSSLRDGRQTDDPDLVVLSDEESMHDEECHDPLPSETRAASRRPAPTRIAPARVAVAPAHSAAQKRQPRRRKASRKSPARSAQSKRTAPKRSRRVSATTPQTTQHKARRPVLDSTDLRQAVIWSEILGPPVCMRGRGGRGGYGGKQ